MTAVPQACHSLLVYVLNTQLPKVLLGDQRPLMICLCRSWWSLSPLTAWCHTLYRGHLSIPAATPPSGMKPDGGQLTLSCQLAGTAAILHRACTSLDTNPPCQSLSWPPNITSASSNPLLESKWPPCCAIMASLHGFLGKEVEILSSAIGKVSRKCTSNYCFSSWYPGNEKPQEGFKEDSTSNAHVLQQILHTHTPNCNSWSQVMRRKLAQQEDWPTMA